jgi:succinate dehydrogenase hydrophobic anchor subunit
VPGPINPPPPIHCPGPVFALDKRRLWEAPALLRLWHVASLDAPTVALAWSCAFAWAAHITVPWWGPASLALIAWAVYIADRLLDARAGMQSPPRHVLRERHEFHWRHRRVFVPLGFLAALAAARIVATRLPAAARIPDTAVATATLAYFSGVHARAGVLHRLEHLLSRSTSKALLIGVLFTAGCLLPAASQVPAPGFISAARVLAMPAMFFAVVAWLNCHAIAQWEAPGSDAAVGPLGRAGALVVLVGALVAVLLAQTEARSALLVAAGTASALLLTALDRFRHRLTPLALRAAADLVLLTPVLLLTFGSLSK